MREKKCSFPELSVLYLKSIMDILEGKTQYIDWCQCLEINIIVLDLIDYKVVALYLHGQDVEKIFWTFKNIGEKGRVGQSTMTIKFPSHIFTYAHFLLRTHSLLLLISLSLSLSHTHIRTNTHIDTETYTNTQTQRQAEANKQFYNMHRRMQDMHTHTPKHPETGAGLHRYTHNTHIKHKLSPTRTCNTQRGRHTYTDTKQAEKRTHTKHTHRNRQTHIHIHAETEVPVV